MRGSDREARRDALQLLAARIEGLLRLGATAEEEPAIVAGGDEGRPLTARSPQRRRRRTVRSEPTFHVAPAVGVRDVSAAAGSLARSRLRGAHVATTTTDRLGR
jgi:hypothetical protein